MPKKTFEVMEDKGDRPLQKVDVLIGNFFSPEVITEASQQIQKKEKDQQEQWFIRRLPRQTWTQRQRELLQHRFGNQVGVAKDMGMRFRRTNGADNAFAHAGDDGLLRGSADQLFEVARTVTRALTFS